MSNSELLSTAEFMCDRCGLCCQNLDRSPLYASLHDGNGICRYYDRETHLCTIYDHRPVICNIKQSYIEMKLEIPYEDYLLLNYEACKALKEGK